MLSSRPGAAVPAGVTSVIAGSLVLAAAFGALRAATVRIWIADGQAWSRGNWLTALLWVAAVAAHLGYDAWWRTVLATTASVPPPWFSTWPSASASSA